MAEKLQEGDTSRKQKEPSETEENTQSGSTISNLFKDAYKTAKDWAVPTTVVGGAAVVGALAYRAWQSGQFESAFDRELNKWGELVRSQEKIKLGLPENTSTESLVNEQYVRVRAELSANLQRSGFSAEEINTSRNNPTHLRVGDRVDIDPSNLSSQRHQLKTFLHSAATGVHVAGFGVEHVQLVTVDIYGSKRTINVDSHGIPELSKPRELSRVSDALPSLTAFSAIELPEALRDRAATMQEESLRRQSSGNREHRSLENGAALLRNAADVLTGNSRDGRSSPAESERLVDLYQSLRTRSGRRPETPEQAYFAEVADAIQPRALQSMLDAYRRPEDALRLSLRDQERRNSNLADSNFSDLKPETPEWDREVIRNKAVRDAHEELVRRVESIISRPDFVLNEASQQELTSSLQDMKGSGYGPKSDSQIAAERFLPGLNQLAQDNSIRVGDLSLRYSSLTGNLTGVSINNAEGTAATIPTNSRINRQEQRIEALMRGTSAEAGIVIPAENQSTAVSLETQYSNQRQHTMRGQMGLDSAQSRFSAYVRGAMNQGLGASGEAKIESLNKLVHGYADRQLEGNKLAGMIQVVPDENLKYSSSLEVKHNGNKIELFDSGPEGVQVLESDGRLSSIPINELEVELRVPLGLVEAANSETEAGKIMANKVFAAVYQQLYELDQLETKLERAVQENVDFTNENSVRDFEQRERAAAELSADHTERRLNGVMLEGQPALHTTPLAVDIAAPLAENLKLGKVITAIDPDGRLRIYAVNGDSTVEETRVSKEHIEGAFDKLAENTRAELEQVRQRKNNADSDKLAELEKMERRLEGDLELIEKQKTRYCSDEQFEKNFNRQFAGALEKTAGRMRNGMSGTATLLFLSTMALQFMLNEEQNTYAAEKEIQIKGIY